MPVGAQTLEAAIEGYRCGIAGMARQEARTHRRILLVGNFLSSARTTRGVCEELAGRLAASGWSVLTTSSRTSRPVRLADMMGTAWRCRRLYDIAHVDVFSGPAFFWAEAVSWVLRRVGKPYVLTLHGGDLPHFALRQPRRVGRLLRSASAVTAPSRYLLDQMRPYRPDLRMIPNPLDIDHYTFGLRRRPEPKLIWLRAFHTIYNPVLMVRVLALLQMHHPNVQLTMVGPDKGDGSLQATRREAERCGIGKRIAFIPGVPKAEVPKYLQAGDIFVNSTNFDNTPVTVMEAMACGLCIVSTNAGGIPYLLEHGRDALLVPRDDPGAMAAAIHRILTEPGLAELLSGNAHRKAEQFDWRAVLPQWEALFGEAL